MTSIQPRTQFSSLPFELREKIWVAACFPRTLELHIHQAFKLVEGPTTEGNTLIGPFRNYILKQNKMTSTYFTATVVSENTTSHRSSYHSDPDHPSCREIAPPPAPVTLSVCHQSRDIALKRYRLSFPGTKQWECPNLAHTDLEDEDWEHGRFDERRIWVDFEHDTLVVACATVNDGFWNRLHSTPLCLMADFAQIETQMVTSVIIGGFWAEYRLHPALSFQRLRALYQGRLVPQFVFRILISELWKFPNLKELVVYYTWEETYGEQFEIFQSVDEARELLVSELSKSRLRQREWTRELPVITLIEDLGSL